MQGSRRVFVSALFGLGVGPVRVVPFRVGSQLQGQIGSLPGRFAFFEASWVTGVHARVSLGCVLA